MCVWVRRSYTPMNTRWLNEVSPCPGRYKGGRIIPHTYRARPERRSSPRPPSQFRLPWPSCAPFSEWQQWLADADTGSSPGRQVQDCSPTKGRQNEVFADRKHVAATCIRGLEDGWAGAVVGVTQEVSTVMGRHTGLFSIVSLSGMHLTRISSLFWP